MSRSVAPRELEVEAAGLIRAALTGDELTIGRIVTRAYARIPGNSWHGWAATVLTPR